MTTAPDIDRIADGSVDDGECDSCDDEYGPGDDPVDGRHARAQRRVRQVGYCAVLVLPFLLAITAGYLRYVGWAQSEVVAARTDSIRVAGEGAVAMLSYRPDTVQNDLDSAKNRMTGAFRDSYSSLVDDVVAPAAVQKMITATASVPASASVSANRSHAVVLLFVNQAVTVGSEPPTTTSSSVRVNLDKIDGRWLISGFDPV